MHTKSPLKFGELMSFVVICGESQWLAGYVQKSKDFRFHFFHLQTNLKRAGALANRPRISLTSTSMATVCMEHRWGHLMLVCSIATGCVGSALVS